MSEATEPRLRLATTAALAPAELAAIRTLMDAAFGTADDAFGDEDWAHALGGVHILLDSGGEIVSHAAVVERAIRIGQRQLRTGYVEAVATAPTLQGRGYGTRVMEAATTYIRDSCELGCLGTGRHHFYGRIGWLTWRGPAFVIAPDGPQRTPDEEGFILVLRTARSPSFDLTEPITCEWRPGDVW